MRAVTSFGLTKINAKFIEDMNLSKNRKVSVYLNKLIDDDRRRKSNPNYEILLSEHESLTNSIEIMSSRIVEIEKQMLDCIKKEKQKRITDRVKEDEKLKEKELSIKERVKRAEESKKFVFGIISKLNGIDQVIDFWCNKLEISNYRDFIHKSVFALKESNPKDSGLINSNDLRDFLRNKKDFWKKENNEVVASD